MPTATIVPQVQSLSEARDWFLQNSLGSVWCIKGDQQRECYCYPEARDFYDEAAAELPEV